MSPTKIVNIYHVAVYRAHILVWYVWW